MSVQYSTPKNPDNSSPKPLNLRWRYFKSLQGDVLAASFASAPLVENPHFIEIDRIEYDHLLKEMES